jgi:hypothetical protein
MLTAILGLLGLTNAIPVCSRIHKWTTVHATSHDKTKRTVMTEI